MTNKEKICKMDYSELLKLLDSHGFCSSEEGCCGYSDCQKCIEEWLKAVV